MGEYLSLLSSPAAWAALVTLVVLELVLGIDNLVFVSILSNKLPAEHRTRVRRLGLGLALIMRLGLLATISWLTKLTRPVFDLGIQGAPNEHGEPWFDTVFSWRDLILLGGGLFLLYKAGKELLHTIRPPEHEAGATEKTVDSVGSAIAQIVLLDIIFSIDSILTAVGMTDHLPIMQLAVVISVVFMVIGADPLGNFIHNNPSVVVLALAFLLMIGVVLIADGLNIHISKAYIYTAMGFSVAVETFNLLRLRNMAKRTPAALVEEMSSALPHVKSD